MSGHSTPTMPGDQVDQMTGAQEIKQQVEKPWKPIPWEKMTETQKDEVLRLAQTVQRPPNTGARVVRAALGGARW